jgi:hypothetical protein
MILYVNAGEMASFSQISLMDKRGAVDKAIKALTA